MDTNYNKGRCVFGLCSLCWFGCPLVGRAAWFAAFCATWPALDGGFVVCVIAPFRPAALQANAAAARALLAQAEGRGAVLDKAYATAAQVGCG